MLLKKFFLAIMTMFAFLCSGFISESYFNKATADSSRTDLETNAENRIKEMYPEFINLVNEGANKNSMMKFALDNLDTTAISKNFCGEKNDKLIESLVNFLLWRLKTATLQTVKEYKLGNDFYITEKKSTISVKCVLNGKNDNVDMVVIFSKNGLNLGKIREIIVLNIPLIDGAKSVMRKYYEKNGIKINALPPKERAQKGCEALDNFVKEND